MKIFDLCRLALKRIKGAWAFTAILGLVISMFCLCYAGAISAKVEGEKAQPFEFVLTAESGKLTDKLLLETSKLADVQAVTPLIETSAQITVNKYKASLQLTGIDAAYIKDGLAAGTAFPKQSVMPYMVLNDSARKAFSDDATRDDTEAEPDPEENTEEGEETASASDEPEIDWINAQYYLQTGEEGRKTAAKVCGLLGEKREKEPPAAYISISAAAELLRKSGQSPAYTGAKVRIINSGCAASISQAMAALGINAPLADESQQEKWDSKLREMAYLIVIALFCLLCTIMLLFSWQKTALLQQKTAWQTLRFLGLRKRDISRLIIIQNCLLSVTGVIIGMIACVSLPSFLLTGENQNSVFILQASFEAVVISAVVCLALAILPFWLIRNRLITGD